MAKPPPGRGRPHRAAFMANKDWLNEQLVAGGSLKEIHTDNPDRFPFSYSNLAKYVGKYLPGAIARPAKPGEPGGGPASVEPSPQQSLPLAPPDPVTPVSRPKVAQDTGPQRFTHSAVPRDIETLI